MRVAILFNPASGQGRAEAEAGRFAAALEAAGHFVRPIPSRPGPDRAWLEGPLREADALLVAGGDGAIRLAAGPAARAGVPVHHLPLGTENLFARQYGGSRTPEEAVAALARGAVRAVDLASIRAGGAEEDFTIMASLGVDAAIVHDLAARRNGPISHLSYLGPVVRQGLAWEPPVISISIDGDRWRELGRGLLVVANAVVYALGIDPVRGADPADGLLDAAFLPCEGSFEALAAALRSLAGGGLPEVERIAASSVRVRARPGGLWQVDGDPGPPGFGSDQEATLAVRPERLRVLGAG
jgi:diacylglycerol kinase family enzyme